MLGGEGLRFEPAGIDHRIPFPARQRVEALVAVAEQGFDLGKHVGMVTSVEQRDLVSALQRRVDDVSPEEHGPAQHQ